jgi:hypothetical protein
MLGPKITIPARDPKLCGGSKRRMYCHVDDDVTLDEGVDDDDDVDGGDYDDEDGDDDDEDGDDR